MASVFGVLVPTQELLDGIEQQIFAAQSPLFVFGAVQGGLVHGLRLPLEKRRALSVER